MWAGGRGKMGSVTMLLNHFHEIKCQVSAASLLTQLPAWLYGLLHLPGRPGRSSRTLVEGQISSSQKGNYAIYVYIHICTNHIYTYIYHQIYIHTYI